MDSDCRQLGMFPLPLTSMERFHWFDSTRGFTNQVYGRFRFRGVIDPDAAQKAADQVIRRHPLLTARIVEESGKLWWRQSPEFTPQIDWCEKTDDSAGPRQINLQQRIPWNVVCRNDGQTTELWFYMSHVVGDGLAGVQIISDWMKFYHHEVTGERIKGWHKLNAQDLEKRNSLGLLKASYLKNLWKQPIALFGASKFIFRKPAEFKLGNDVAGAWDYDRQPAIKGIWLNERITNSLKDAAERLSVSLNTLLVASLMQTLEEYCRTHSERLSKWIRIILPMSIRNFADRRMPATNRATIVQVDRCSNDFSEPGFLSGLDREIRIIREWELGKLFLIFVRAMGLIPGAIKAAASNPKCRGTAVFANLAEPFGRIGLPIVDNELLVGDLKLKEFDFAGPVRNKMPVNFTSQRHLGRLRFSLHFDPRVIKSEEASGILTSLQRNLETSID